MKARIPAALLLVLAPLARPGAAESSPQAAPPAVLTLEEALRIARERSPDLAIAETALASARAQVQVAGALPNPSASFLAGWSSQCGQPGCDQPAFVATLGDQGAVAALVTGQRGLALDAAGQGVRGAEATREDARRSLDFQVKQQFVTTVVAARTERFARDEAAIADRTVETARQGRGTGAVSESDLVRLQVMHGQIEQLAGRAGQAFHLARASLARLLGFRADAANFAVDPGPTVAPVVPPRLVGATVASLLETARENRPDLAAARAQLEQARSQAMLARRLVIPQFQLQGQYQQQGSSGGGWFTPPTAWVGLSVPLPVLYQQQGQIGQADAGVLAAEATVRKVEAQVLADVSTAFASLQASRRNAERAQAQLVPRARDARNLVGNDFARGAGSLLDYLDAQRSLLHVEIEQFASLGDFWTAVFQVERAVGVSFLP